MKLKLGCIVLVISTFAVNALAAKAWQEAAETAADVTDKINELVEKNPLSKPASDLVTKLNKTVEETVGGRAGQLLGNVGNTLNPFQPSNLIDATRAFNRRLEVAAGGCRPGEFCYSTPNDNPRPLNQGIFKDKIAMNLHTIEGFDSLSTLDFLFDKINVTTIEWARIDMYWSMIEIDVPRILQPGESIEDLPKEPGVDYHIDASGFLHTYRWDYMDEMVRIANQHAVHLLAVLAGPPTWASEGGQWQGRIANPENWTEFVKRAAKRYGAKGISHFEVWNEPNLERFNLLEAGTSSANRATAFTREVIIPAADAIHQASADLQKQGKPVQLKVVGPALSHSRSRFGGGSEDWDVWFKTVLNLAGGKIDVISHHIYDKDGWFVINSLQGKDSNLMLGGGQSQNIRDFLDELRDENGNRAAYDGSGNKKEFWLTETGWSSSEKAGEGVGEGGQKIYTQDFLRRIQDVAWVNKVFIYAAIDLPIGFAGVDREVHWGLFRIDRTAKPVFDEVFMPK